ncbi:MAG: hypothetical protein GOMPHAMPRED_002337 [Gomphillus americanus]|uniref:Uncharacterized protein n=1 Tax=Gomphillus americanus TaxID=1940652 RepID=A0A8H3INF8_9LECA|nr:MAG: hypothetical protein GOMPHAMPRED_002337 [Gomphillus americanus]
MSTPHRGLPPPLGMTLPNPNPMSDRGHPPPPPPPPPPSQQQQQQHPSSLQQNQPMGQLPAPPSTQWPGSADAMRDWLAAKAEEDKRKQEEERTRQETLRLEQRKIEQSMLRESLQGGIPPHMVPIVFAGMGGGNLANAGIEWAQYYMSQMTVQAHPISQAQLPPPPPPQQPPQQHQQQQPQQQGSPDLRRDRSYTGPQPNPYAAHQPPQSRGYPFDGTRPGQAQIQAGPTSVPRPSASSLSRLNTGEMSIHQPPSAGSALPTQQSHPPSQAEPTAQSTPNSTSNSIYFHHWVPPNNAKEAGSPSDFTHSPKKRKTISHGKSPETSPAFSHPTSAGRHIRALSTQKSEASTDSSRGSGPAAGQMMGNRSRPVSRHRQPSLSSVVDSGVRRGSSQRESSQTVSPSDEYSRKRSRSGSPRQDS